jgi:hypothetical protein
MLTSSRSRFRHSFYVFCILSAAATRVDAQLLAPNAVVVGDLTPATNRPQVLAPAAGGSTSALVRMRFPVRVGAGALGSVGGAAVGLFAGLMLPHGNCGCDDPGLENAVIGAMVGSFVTGTFAAAIPELGSSCGFEKRVAVAAVGGALGALVGTKAVPRALGGAATGWVAGSGIGSGVGAWLCR